MVRTEAFGKAGNQVYLYLLTLVSFHPSIIDSAVLDPDPGPHYQYGSGSRTSKSMRIHPDNNFIKLTMEHSQVFFTQFVKLYANPLYVYSEKNLSSYFYYLFIIVPYSFDYI
jgi:hypothetical protein